MGWSNGWPVERWSSLDDETVFNELVAALEERDALVPAGYVPGEFDRLAVVKGVPAGWAGPTGLRTVANFQYEIGAMLAATSGWRWWDRSRGAALAEANLLGDVLGQAVWSYDLRDDTMRWTPPFAVIFNELREVTSAMTCLSRLAASAASGQTDSVYNLTFGITDFAAQRAATMAMFDGSDDGATTGLVYDVGLSAILFDGGSDQQWYVDAREATLGFNTSSLDGYTVSRAWVEVETAASPGATDYSGTFTAQVVAPGGSVRGTFASDDYSVHTVELDAGDVATDGVTTVIVRSAAANAADRPAWSPPGPDYSSTYREGFVLGGTVRLVVEVEFDYRA